MSDLTAVLAEPNWDSPVVLPINAADLAWRIGGRGEASLEFNTATLRYAGLLDCRGSWLYVQRGDVEWSGVVQIARDDLASATTEVAAQTFEALLDKKLTAKEYHIGDGDAGDTAAKVVVDAGKDGAMFIDGFRIGRTALVDIDIRSEQVVDAIDQLAQLAGAEWRIVEDRTSGRPLRYLEFAPVLGRNLSASVVLATGKNLLADGEVLRDLSPVVNEIAAFSQVAEYTRQTAVGVRDDESIEQIGRRQDALYLPYSVKQSALRTAAKQELAGRLKLGRSATVDVANVGHVWATFREGDTVRLIIPDSLIDHMFRVLVRTWSSSSGDRMTLTGSWSEVAA